MTSSAWILFLLVVICWCHQGCRDITCPIGSEVKTCSQEGEQDKCVQCKSGTYLTVVSSSQNPMKCQKHHCTPEARQVFKNETRAPWLPPECHCDTTRGYWGSNSLNCQKKEKPCPPSKTLDRITGHCVCPVTHKEENGVCKLIEVTTVIPIKGEESEDSQREGKVITGVVCGIVAVIIVPSVVLAVCCLRCRRKINSRKAAEEGTNPEESALSTSVDDSHASDDPESLRAANSDNDDKQIIIKNINIHNFNYQQGENNSIKCFLSEV